MKRWLIALTVSLGLLAPAAAFWQSRDSNYNVAIGGAPPAFTGPGDVAPSAAVAWFGLRAYSAATAGNRAINLCDNTGANCTDISTNATTGKLNNPGTLGANNCATSGTCQIAVFYDQTLGNNCTSATCDVTQATAASRPTLNFNCINGLPCAVFSGSQSITGANTHSNLVATGTLSAVAERTGNFSSFNGMIEVGPSGLGWSSSPNQAILFAGSVAAFTASDNAFHSFVGVFDGGSASIGYTDNVPTSGLTPGTNAFQGVFSIGQINGGAFPLTGNFSEGGYWAAQFTSGQVTSMCHNQFGFWGTSASC